MNAVNRCAARLQARGIPAARVLAIPASEYPARARRPANSRLDNGHLQRTFGIALPSWEDALDACMAEPAVAAILESSAS